MVLGLSLASVGVQEAEANWPIAIITFLIAVGVNNFSKRPAHAVTATIIAAASAALLSPFPSAWWISLP